MAELLEKIPAEKRWAITAKALLGFIILRGYKTVMPLLGKAKGIVAPVWGWEKYKEIAKKIWGEGGMKMWPRVKEILNIAIEDAVVGAKLTIATATLLVGPEFRAKIVKTTPERTIAIVTLCPYWENYTELEQDPDLMLCDAGCQAWAGEGIKAVDPKLSYTLIKSLAWGDPHCEVIVEFKEA